MHERGFGSVSEVGTLQYFTHSVEGRLYGGWYRPTGSSVEVYARGQVRVVRTGDRSAVEVAQSVLADIVRRSARRGDLRQPA
jgi:hypothetical protein